MPERVDFAVPGISGLQTATIRPVHGVRKPPLKFRIWADIVLMAGPCELPVCHQFVRRAKLLGKPQGRSKGMNVAGMQQRLAVAAAVDQVGDVPQVQEDPGHVSVPETLMAATGAAMSSPER